MPNASADLPNEGLPVPNKALAKVFLAKTLVALEGAGVSLPARDPTGREVDCKFVGNGATPHQCTLRICKSYVDSG